MDWHLAAVFLVTFIASVMSGMAGGGGGFILIPFYIWLGLTPQQAVATLKFASFGLSAGAISAFREKMLESKGFTLFIMAISTVVGMAASFTVITIGNHILQLLMGALMLVMLPVVVLKNRRLQQHKPTNLTQAVGTLALIVVLFLQGVAGSGVGSLVTVIFILFFGATTLDANVLKRKSSILLNVIVVVGLLGSGLINFKYGLFGMAGGLAGGYIGSRTAVKKGDNFARYALLVFMAISGIWLIATA